MIVLIVFFVVFVERFFDFLKSLTNDTVSENNSKLH